MSHQLRRKNVKKGVQFNVMVAGKSGLGKSSFINTLCEKEVIPPQEGQEIQKTMKITPYQTELDEDGVKINLTVLDTPGFGDALNNSAQFQDILSYIHAQFDEVLLEESRIKRNPKFIDNRVDCLLYFIQPTGHNLKETDLLLMKELATSVNVIPVIGKSDSLTREELQQFKKRIKQSLKGIRYYQFPNDDEEDPEEVKQENAELRELLPFAVVTADGVYDLNGRKVRGRELSHGIVEVDNVKHCDFARLRFTLFTSHLQELKSQMQEFLYEDYRTFKLSLEEKKIVESATSASASTNQDISAADVVKQVWLKEELLKKEEEKLREMELKIQKDLEQRRRELFMKEQSLKELEQKLENK